MGIFEHFPYVNFHELNLDWLLAEVKKLKDNVDLLNLSYEELKEYVDNYFSELNISAELRDVIQEMIDDGTLLNLIMSYVNMDYVTPDQYKTTLNTWEQAFSAAFGSGKKVMIPNKTYTLSEPFIVDESMVIANEGTYTNQKVIVTKPDPFLFKKPKSEYVHKDYTTAFGVNTTNGSQGWGWNSAKNKWIHASIVNNSDIYLIETTKDLLDDNATLIETAGYPINHCGSVTYCPVTDLVYIAGCSNNQVWAIDSNYNKSIIVLPTSANEDIELFIWDDKNNVFYGFSQAGQCIHVFDSSYTLLKTYSYTSNTTKISAMLPYGAGYYTYKQEPIVIDGNVYMLYSIWSNDTYSGYAVTYLDIHNNKEYVVQFERYNFPKHQVEAQGIAYNGETVLIVGAFATINLLFTFGNMSNNVPPKTGESTIFVYLDTNSAHSNGNGSQSAPFTIEEAGEYFTNYTNIRLVLMNTSREMTISNFNGYLWWGTGGHVGAKINIINSDCRVATGGLGTAKYLQKLNIENSHVLIDSSEFDCAVTNAITITNGSVVTVRNCKFNASGLDSAIYVTNCGLVLVRSSNTSADYLIWCNAGGCAINMYSNSGATNAFKTDASGRIIT